MTVRRTSVSPDLQRAVVFVTPLGDTANAHQSVHALQRAAPYVRRELSALIHMYRVPAIHFQLDPEMMMPAPEAGLPPPGK